MLAFAICVATKNSCAPGLFADNIDYHSIQHSHFFVAVTLTQFLTEIVSCLVIHFFGAKLRNSMSIFAMRIVCVWARTPLPPPP